MKKQKMLSCLLAGTLAFSAMPGIGINVLADELDPVEAPSDVTAPQIENAKIYRASATGFNLAWAAKDENGIGGAYLTFVDGSGETKTLDYGNAKDMKVELEQEITEKTPITLTVFDKYENKTELVMVFDPMYTTAWETRYLGYEKSSASKIWNDHLYLRYDKNYNWPSAEAFAQRIGGHLICVNDAEENQMLTDFIADGTSGNYYLGYTDYIEEGNWVWIDGSTTEYTSWNGGEPNNSGNEDFCHIYRGRNVWNDLPGNGEFGFVVEVDLNAIRTSSEKTVTDWDKYQDFYSEYTFWGPVSYEVAEALIELSIPAPLETKDTTEEPSQPAETEDPAENEAAPLKFVSIDSENENTFIADSIKDMACSGYYIGLNRNSEGNFETDAEAYSNFADVQTAGYNYAVIFGSDIDEAGKWHAESGFSVGANGKLGFITEKELPTPTASPTPEPTATATPEPTATATPEPTATATPEPTATATPEPTATATPEPTATAAPEPTTEPTVAPTVEPTVEPTAEPTVKPTVEPTVTSEVTPVPTMDVTADPTITPIEGSEQNGEKASDEAKKEIMDFVKRIYTYVLDREPEEEGAAFWSNELWNFNRTGAEVGLQFIFSDEFTARNLNDTDFVTVLYKTFFGREPEAEGLNFWTGALKDGSLDRMGVAMGFVYSQEWADTCAKYGIRSGGEIKPSFEIAPSEATLAFVERMYTTAMNRESDQGGKEFWSKELANFRYTGEQVGVMFFLSDEMESFNLSNEDFVTRLYKTFMDREPEQGGYEFWVNFLKEGNTRESVVLGFTRSEEFVNKCIEARILPF